VLPAESLQQLAQERKMNAFAIKDFWILDVDSAASIANFGYTVMIQVHWRGPSDCPNPKPVPHHTGDRFLKRPVKVSLHGKRRMGDFNANSRSMIIVGERVRRLVEENRLKGFAFLPLKFVRHNPIKGQAFSTEELEGRFWELGVDLTLPFGASYPFRIITICEQCGWQEQMFPKTGKLSFDTSP
jgi:hypothetical protein